jgi:CubicO group peptidase (beta-lactamase class C family)
MLSTLKENKGGLIIIAFVALLALGLLATTSKTLTVAVKKLDDMVEGTWQSEVKFPDWKGWVDNTLAMNSMYSFDGYKGQGKLYLTIDKDVQSFDLFINNSKVNTVEMKSGVYELDYSRIAVDGMNTIQVSNIKPSDLKEAITLNVPYPTVVEGSVRDSGINNESFKLIDEIISADIENGFSSAQLAVIKDGKLVYQNAWGQKNAYNKDGTRITDGEKVTNDTLYDLASNTKMYSVAYAIQYLVDNGKLNLDDRIVDIMGNDFVDNTIEIRYASYADYPGFDAMKRMKAGVTVRNVMMHQAGFPDSGHYHNEFFDIPNQQLSDDVRNVLYVADANSEKTLHEGIYKTPLIYAPGTKTLYSDIDYMLLGKVVERVTGKDLNTFLAETFWQPMELKHITYNPLDHGFNSNDCAATELNGNTRDGLISFPRVRLNTIQCEVHDEESFYMMDGVSGHAGLFANATDLAKLAYAMLSGGYGNNKFFGKNTRDVFIAPQAVDNANYGIGWWREADDRRVYYFGTQAAENTIGHQGSTGTLTMIDYENDMVVVFLTNKLNSPIVNPMGLENANDFGGSYYTTATLGFVPQIIYAGMDGMKDPREAFKSLVSDMVTEKQKLVDETAEKTGKALDNHPILNGKKAIEDVAKKRK